MLAGGLAGMLSDIYSLGVVFWEVFTRSIPFDALAKGRPNGMLLVSLLEHYKERSAGAGLDCGLLPLHTHTRAAALVGRMVSVDAAQRPPDCGQVVAELQAVFNVLSSASRKAAQHERGKRSGGNGPSRAAGAGPDARPLERQRVEQSPAGSPVSSADSANKRQSM